MRTKNKNMLSDFFRINLPYGIVRNENGEWSAFNREYLPLGFKDESFRRKTNLNSTEIPIYTKYKRVTEKFLLDIADGENSVERNEKKEIIKVFLYNDGTNPRNQSIEKKFLWDNYFEKLKKLSKLMID